MNFYHLVTRVPMTEDQIIDFTNENHNRLYDFWMKRIIGLSGKTTKLEVKK